MAKIPNQDLFLVMGDMNAKVCSENNNYEREMRMHGCGVMNSNGERVVEFCSTNNFVIGGTRFARPGAP